jgi:membrane dipeptidase
LNTIADLQTIPERLAKRGYSAASIEKIMHGNWIRFFKTALQ